MTNLNRKTKRKTDYTTVKHAHFLCLKEAHNDEHQWYTKRKVVNKAIGLNKKKVNF